MIGYLNGSTFITGIDNVVTVVVQGVGYEVRVSDRDRERIAREARVEVELYCRTVAKENEISIYGFLDVNDRRAFDRLQMADGVGPSAALRILSVIDHDRLCALVSNGTEDEEASIVALTKVPGIGKVTAIKIATQVKM